MVAPAKSPVAGPNPPRTEGLNELDRDRAASVADEGGASAATVEFQRPPRSTKAHEVNGTADSRTLHIKKPGTQSA